MAGNNGTIWATLGAIGALSLVSACDNGPSAVASKQAAGTQMASAAGPEDSGGPQVDHRKDAVRLVDGKPMWSASKRFSADESAQHSFDRNGEAFGAKSLDDFIRKARAFVEHPPAGVQTFTRANGDRLFYDPKGNIFAVANKDGAPRTMFKPDDGAAYWDQQKDREAKRQTARSEHRSKKADDEA
jgi:pyocin large subunit-like protein